METKHLNENIAKSLKIVLNCTDDDLELAARDELPEEKKDLLDALGVIDVYYRQKRSSRNNLIPTREFAFYVPYVNILDNPEISGKYDYYREEKRIYERERKIQESLNREWKKLIQPDEEKENGMKLAASRQSHDDILRQSGNGASRFLQFTSKEESAKELTLIIHHVNNDLNFILQGDYGQIKHIKSLVSNGQSVPLSYGFGTIAISNFMKEFFPIYIIDDEGNKIEMIMLDENKNPLE